MCLGGMERHLPKEPLNPRWDLGTVALSQAVGRQLAGSTAQARQGCRPCPRRSGGGVTQAQRQPGLSLLSQSSRVTGTAFTYRRTGDLPGRWAGGATAPIPHCHQAACHPQAWCSQLPLPRAPGLLLGPDKLGAAGVGCPGTLCPHGAWAPQQLCPRSGPRCLGEQEGWHCAQGFCTDAGGRCSPQKPVSGSSSALVVFLSVPSLCPGHLSPALSPACLKG